MAEPLSGEALSMISEAVDSYHILKYYQVPMPWTMNTAREAWAKEIAASYGDDARDEFKSLLEGE